LGSTPEFCRNFTASLSGISPISKGIVASVQAERAVIIEMRFNKNNCYV